MSFKKSLDNLEIAKSSFATLLSLFIASKSCEKGFFTSIIALGNKSTKLLFALQRNATIDFAFYKSKRTKAAELPKQSSKWCKCGAIGGIQIAKAIF